MTTTEDPQNRRSDRDSEAAGSLRRTASSRMLTGLSARALALAVLFVLLAEAVLFVPWAGRWLEQ
ncbi:MAG: hypothetical protein VX077_00360 [Pseudomonadota bacterium]|nr:hypothetical protein [Pseudomonadota bacterium]